MCSSDMTLGTFDVKRVARSKLHKYLILDKPEEKILNEIFNGPACIYQQTKNGHSALFLALAKNKENVVKKLMEIYENDFKSLKENGFNNDTGLLIAFKADEIAFVEKKLSLFAAENIVESENKSRNTLLIMMKETNESTASVKKLIWKSEEEHKICFDIIARLHKNGTFDSNLSSVQNDNLFHAAASKGFIWVLEKLLAYGARYDAPNKQSQTPFEFACTNNQLETVKWFHKTFKIDLLKFMTEGNALFNIASSGSFDTFEYILSEIKRFDGDEHIEEIFNRKTDYHDNNFLMQAINCVQYDFAEKCLKYDVELSAVDSSNNNILHLLLCSWPGSQELCGKLFKQLPKLLLVENSNQMTPLHLLSTRNYIEEFKEIYANFPTFKNSFFKHFVDSPTIQKAKEQIWCPTPGHNALNDVIANDLVAMADFIIENHPDEFESPEYVSGLVNLQKSSSDSFEFIDRLKKLKSLDINVPDINNIYPLKSALLYNRLETFNFLLKSCNVKDLNLMVDSYSKANLLHSAVFINPVKITGGPYKNCCLRYYVDSSDEDEDKKTDVVDPAFSMPVVESSAEEPTGVEANAERTKKFQIFKYLLELGVDVNNKDSFGKSLLHVAVEADNIEVVQELLKLGLDIEGKDENGNIPLHYVRSVEVFRALMETGMNSEHVNLKNAQQRTPFMSFVALFFNDEPPLELFNEFMKHNADVNTSGNEGFRPIHTAFIKEWTAQLIEHGADVTATNHAGENILHIALRNYKYDLANYLLRRTNIDHFAVTNEGTSYLGFLSVDTANYHQTFSGGLKHVFIEWIDKFIDGKNVHGGVILNDFITAGDISVLNHPKANFHQREADGQTCLHHAINLNVKVEIVKFLVEKGMDINAVNENGFTPLMFAVDYNYTDKALFLIDQENINLNDVNAYGFAALHYVARNENVEVLCKLLSAGADPKILNHDNQTFYDLLSEFDKKLFACYVAKN